MEQIEPTKTLVEKTYDILLDAICTGEFSPGQRLNQDEIAARLNVSRQPVNSAISILKANCFVSDTGRRGVIVTEIDPGQSRSIYEFREVVEPLAVRLACARRDPGAGAEAQKMLRSGRAAIEAQDIKALIAADVQFHEMIYRWSGNHVIETSMRVNWAHMRRAMLEILRDPSRARTSWDDHETIVSHMLNDDPEAAAAAMTDHIHKAFEKSRAALDRAGRKTRDKTGQTER